MIDLWTMIMTLVVGAIITMYYYLRGPWTFFTERGIPHANQYPFFSNFWTLFVKKKNMAEMMSEVYPAVPGAKYVGIYDFATPMIMIRDLELIKSIMIKNIEHFQDHRSFQMEEVEPIFGKNLFSLRGERWKEVRTLLSPAFTSSKMKAMYKLMRECANKYGEHFAAIPEKDKSIELKDAFTRYTNDVIATCAFGVNVDSMADRNNKFYVNGRTATKFGKWQTAKFFLVRSFPWLFRFTGLKVFDTKVTQFFTDLIQDTINTRDEQGIVRPDMIQLMMETRGKMGPGKELSIVDMTAQAFVFFLGGFESTSVLMCFAAYEVGVNPEIQKRLQEEIDDVLEKSNGEVTYEAVNDMKYLDAIINEALRMYPAAVFTDRACTKPFELPPAKPGLKPYVVQKDEYIWIPIYGVQNDPQYFEEPTKFKPERFIDDPKKILNSGMFLSFGLGPRMCIGNRFALLETKVLLFNLFARCNLKPNARTTIPMELSRDTFQMTAKGGFWFDIEPRKLTARVLVNSVSNGSAIH
nr:cytochrome P450 9e2-like [Megalopta genalis]